MKGLVMMKSNTDLLEIVHAMDSPRRLATRGDCRQKQSEKNTNDRHDDN